MPDLAAATAGPPAGKPPDHLVVVDDELENQVEADAEVSQQLVQCRGLRNGAGKAVEQETVARIGLGEPVPHHVDGHLVRNELAGVHVPLGLDSPSGVP